MKFAQADWRMTVLRYLWQCCLACCMLWTANAYAEQTALTAEQAFQFSADSVNTKHAVLTWKIQPNFYLYQHKFEVKQGAQPLKITFPPAISQHDENFGDSRVYYHQVSFQIKTQPQQDYVVSWQGCEKDRICYPPQTIHIQTDADGLIIPQDQAVKSYDLLSLSEQANTSSLAKNTASSATVTTLPDRAVADQADKGLSQDQQWTAKLSEHSLAYSLLLFLGLGCLLAFTPCSLPMLPIVSSLLLREQRGLKAWVIALVFVCSMACVYAGLGVVAASAGLNFQRWLQQPITLVAFSLLFVLFALNLFGLFELKIPQVLMQRLDRLQATQQGGTLFGAAIMGAVSALLVGPCMTAPLAGALLFIAQTQQQWQGAVLLFTLGFGMGIPLLIVSVLGSKILPKVGDWMQQIKVIFAFVMLGLALYFIRPILPTLWMQILHALFFMTVIAYFIFGMIKHVRGLKYVYVVALIGLIPTFMYQQYQFFQAWVQPSSKQEHVWHVAKTAKDFQQLLAKAPHDQAVIVDVYADWCVACQPIEHQVLKQADVQQALSKFYLIKLDLSQYDSEHEALLAQWNILGPPTYLFLNAQHQEKRNLRLTGAFKAKTLIQHLAQLQP
ncbi:MAG: protein-disulfide reductase DsbD [Acinetobacter sp.]